MKLKYWCHNIGRQILVTFSFVTKTKVREKSSISFSYYKGTTIWHSMNKRSKNIQKDMIDKKRIVSR